MENQLRKDRPSESMSDQRFEIYKEILDMIKERPKREEDEEKFN